MKEKGEYLSMNNLGIINEVKTDCKAIAFTFDDGPNPLYTKQLLEIFQQVSGKATFFMIGEQMEKHPEVVAEVYEQNHEIGNHTFTHPGLTKLSGEECYLELEKTEKLITQLTGKKPVLFRPPYIDYNEETKKIVDRFQYKTIGALNGDALDWEQPGVEFIVKKTKGHIRNGSILIFHDGFGDRSQSIEAVRLLVAELVEEGYQLVTVSELLSNR